MTATGLALTGALWAQAQDDESETLPLWKAALIALAAELLVPILLFGIDWSFLHLPAEPPPTPVMSVRLEPAPEVEPRPPQPQVKPKPLPAPKRVKRPAIPIEPPRPVPNEVPSRIALPERQPEPRPVPRKEEKEPEPAPEPAPLPSVFRDVKPVKKVKPVYPPEAEAQHIQGRVKVRLSVALDGSVTDVQILASEPAGVFEEAVLAAVRQYKFKRDGTAYQADQEVVFKIDD